MKKYDVLLMIILLSIIGLITSSYGLYLHYAPLEGDAFCNINDVFNCDAVNKGQYSKLFGIPVALIGIGGYVSFLMLSILDMKNFFGSPMNRLMLALAIIGFAFSLYLTYLEAFVIHAWCIVCIGSALIMLAILVFVIIYHNICEGKRR